MNRLLIKLCLLTVCTTAAVGCGGGGGGTPPAKPGKVSMSGAASVVSMTNNMQTALKANNGGLLSSSVVSLSLTGPQQMVTPAVGAALTASTSSALSTPGPNGGTVDCDQTGCTYNMYKSGTITMNGTVRSAATTDSIKVTENLTVTATNTTGLAGTVDWDLTGDMTFTATSINGNLQSNGHYNLTAGGTAVSEDFFEVLQYNAVLLGTAGTAIGGSIYAKWGATVAGVPAASQAWEGTATFP